MKLWQRPEAVLMGHFFRGLFESDLFSVRDRLTTAFAGIISLMASFGLMLPLMFNHKYHVLNALSSPGLYREAALADKLMFICISFVVTVLVTTLEWQALFPSQQDVLILCPLPISRAKVFCSKFLALLFFICVLNFGVSVLPSAMMPMVMSGKWQLPQGTLMHFFALFLACFLAGIFAFFSLISLQALLMNLMPARWFNTASLILQSLLILLALTALPILLWIPNLHSFMRTEWAGAFWCPPIWFLGWEEQMLGIANPFAQSLAGNARLGLVLVLATSLVLYALVYVRNSGQLLVSGSRGADGRFHRLVSGLLHRAGSNAHEVAVMSFILKTLFRSRLHKMLLFAILGLSFSLSFDSFSSLWITHWIGHGKISRHAIDSAILSTPLIVSFFLLCGLRFIFLLPVDSRSNWAFRLNETDSSQYAVDATEKVMLMVAALPILAITFGALALWFGIGAGLIRSAFVLMLCLILIEGLLWNWDRIPFACPYLPGKRNIIQSLILYGVAFSFFAYIATVVEMVCLSSLVGTGVLFAALLFTVYFMRLHRRQSYSRGLLLRFDDLPESEVQLLQLQPD